MARLKDVKRGVAMLVLDFDKQLEPGSFEHALCHMVDHGLDLTGLLERIRNDDSGAPAYDPAVLLKIVLLAYSRGIISSRKMEKQAQQMIEAHRQADAQPDREDQRQAVKLDRLQREAEQLRQWLKDNPKDRLGTQNNPIMSNRTDNESAKMATDKGVIQGYTGVATVDDKHQIVVDAQAFGTGSENALLAPVVDATAHLRNADTVITADAGYHSKAGLEHLHQQEVQAFIADNNYRKRDPRYEDQDHYKDKGSALHNKQAKETKPKLFGPEDFCWNEESNTCTCPAGKRLYGNGKDCTINGNAAVKFRGAKQDCGPCALREQCLRKPEVTPTRQVAFFIGKRPTDKPDVLGLMRQRIDSDQGKHMITRRFATVEPVFGNLRYNKRLSRFTLRGKAKVDGQFKLYAMMHNIEKFAGSGYAQ